MKLHEIATVVTGGTPSTSVKEYWEQGNIPWLQSGSCKNDVIYKPDKYITELGLKNSSAIMMPVNTVVIALTGATTGKVGILGIDACANQSVTGVLPNNKFFHKYMFYYLMSKREKILHDSYGAAQPHISQGYVKNIEIILPDIEHQKNIALYLDKIQEAIRNRKAILDDYNELIDSSFNKIYSKKCKFIQLREIMDVRDGTHDSPKYLSQSNYLLITGKNIVDGEIDFTDIKYISEEDYNNINKRSKVEFGDIIMPMIGTIGNPVIVKNEKINFAIKNVALFKKSNNILPEVLLAFLKSKHFKTYSTNNNKGGIQKFLSLRDIRNMPIKEIDMNEQNIFSKNVKIINAQKELIQRDIRDLESLFKSKMHEYFD